MPNILLHQAIIGGIKFDCLMTESGPYISSPNGGVNLGDCTSIVYIGGELKIYIAGGDAIKKHTSTGFYVAKYRNQPRIPLVHMTLEQVEMLSSEFGIPFDLNNSGDLPPEN